MAFYSVLLIVGLFAFVVRAHARRALQIIQIPFIDSVRCRELPAFLKKILRALDFLAIVSFVLLCVYALVGGGPLSFFYAHFSSPMQEKAIYSRRVFFVIDRSGSMEEKILDQNQVPKIDVVKEAVSSAVVEAARLHGENDLFGLETFARSATVVVPLTRNRNFFLRTLKNINPETIDYLNGTAIGYAIFKATTLITACNELAEKSSASQNESLFDSSIILITDGLEEPHPDDRKSSYRSMRNKEALRIAKDNQITVNYINIDKSSYQRMPSSERDTLIDAVQDTGGRYFESTSSDQLQEILLNLIEKTKILPEKATADYEPKALFFLAAVVLFSLCSARAIETIFLKAV